MKCSYHPDLDSTSSCTVCGRSLCSACSHSIKGRIYCQDCIVEGASLAAVARRPEVASYSPGRAALFALIPGIGAVYNRQYTKALVHFATFCSLILLADYGSEVFGLGAFSFYVFTIVDAYRSAQAIQRRRITEPHYAEDEEEMQLPIWGGVLILLGILFFLNNLGAFSLRSVVHYSWPLFFVAVGAYLMLSYFLKSPPSSKPAPPAYPDSLSADPLETPQAPPAPTPPAENSQGE